MLEVSPWQFPCELDLLTTPCVDGRIIATISAYVSIEVIRVQPVASTEHDVLQCSPTCRLPCPSTKACPRLYLQCRDVRVTETDCLSEYTSLIPRNEQHVPEVSQV